MQVQTCISMLNLKFNGKPSKMLIKIIKIKREREIDKQKKTKNK